ncbi:MAG: peptidoglycan-associated lipoprotein Pal [Nitrospirota bacterium]|nr:peptidoglycan-associated lipoprotein Pal [Nitrospirota bacterium]
MSTRCHLSSFHFWLCLLVVAVLSGCASRKIVTSVEDQSFVSGPAPQAQAPVAEATVPPPTPIEAAKAEPTPVQVDKAVPPPAVKEARVVEQPIAPAPPSQPPAPAARPIQELSDIFFDFDRFSIRDDARAGLEANAGLLKSPSGEKVLIEGHCDERGTSAYNLVLGERRAQAVVQYLRDLGVPASQMQITSYGKERPFCTEHSEACWQSNRRAHFTR